MEKIGHKILAFILALCLIIPTSSVFAIDEEGIEEVKQPQIEEIKEEVPAEELKEEVKEEVKEESQEIKEEVKEEEKEIDIEKPETIPQDGLAKETKKVVMATTSKINNNKNNVDNESEQNQEEIIYPFTVTYLFMYRKGSQTIQAQKWYNTITESTKDKIFTNSIKMRAVDKAVYNNKADSFDNDMSSFQYTGRWIGTINGEKIVYTKDDTIKMNAANFTKETTIVFNAEFEETPKYRIYFDALDYIGHGTHHAGHEDVITAYSWTCKTPADVPEDKYQFLYWEDEENQKQYKAGDTFTAFALGQTKDTTYTLIAKYQPAVIVNYFIEEKLVNSVQSFSQIQVYDYVVENELFESWLDEEGTQVKKETIYNAPEISANGECTIINLKAHFITPDPEPELTPEPTPISDPTPRVKPTLEPTSEPTPVAPTKPTELKKDNTIVKNQITTKVVTTETYTETRVISPLSILKATESTIEKSKTPLAKPQGTWALLNLIFTIISCLIAIILLFIKKKTENDEYTDKEEKDIRSMRRFKLFSILFGIISIIVFIFTEDMTMPMVWIDRWTILMAIFAGIEIANIFIIRQKAQEEETEEEE